MSQTTDRIVPFPPLQQAMIDWLELEHRRHTMHALLQVDVTAARRAIGNIGPAPERRSR